jgi:hypothetical protein
MIRTTLLGLAAAATVAASAATPASASVKLHFGTSYFGGYEYGYFGGRYTPVHAGYNCHRVIVSFKPRWTDYGWIEVPRQSTACDID